jgi:hypothetical protein
MTTPLLRAGGLGARLRLNLREAEWARWVVTAIDARDRL